MCLLIYKPEGVIIPKERLFNGFTHNLDGAGFAICEKDKDGNPELNIYKGLFEWKEFWREWEPKQEKQAIVHFRAASTNQPITGDNTHPFRVLPEPNDIVMAHNGYIYGLPKKDMGDRSDTATFSEFILQPLAKQNPDFWLMSEFKWFIEQSIGSNNKIVMMDVKGRYNIFNESKGDWDDKAWFSNNDYKYKSTFYWDDDGDIDFDKVDEPKFDNVSRLETHGPLRDDVIDVEAEVEHARQAQESSIKTETAEFQKEFTTYELSVLDDMLEKENATR